MKYLYSDLTQKIIGAAVNVHKELGPGHPEKIYQRALAEEFTKQEIQYIREKRFDIFYNGKSVGYETMDFIAFDKIAIELKAAREIMDLHAKQLVGYLKGANIKLGLILNFGKNQLEIKRVII
ncbi:MAG: GxxExxY protein [Candidatus Levybacteria bacterium]|nr:GxxExxY protein [Candidatus Levybacteria bacterium]